ncbi:MAG: pyridoxamine 5'-phosphate oxidase family protein [Candidatus Pacebacteria bacterium]|nr:pyridoxamine 5'-phosphate oxidase family protein [Candidatus Paceibacterota bacterium]MDD5357076.1 pyridoxamine 5'-phosphate oxidase family protein [Candidatus Paceibacterota bacterium]
MPPEILNYIKTERVGVLAVEMLDGSPHAATVHFAHTENPLVFYFETYREYRKAEPLFSREVTRASFVIGTDERIMKTLQFDGIVQLLKKDEMEIFDSVYLGKFPEKKEKSKDPKFVFFKFIPNRWRFTDWKTPNGKAILTSK